MPQDAPVITEGGDIRLAFSSGILQWDPKIEVLYHIRPYFVGIFPYIGLIYRPI